MNRHIIVAAVVLMMAVPVSCSRGHGSGSTPEQERKVACSTEVTRILKGLGRSVYGCLRPHVYDDKGNVLEGQYRVKVTVGVLGGRLDLMGAQVEAMDTTEATGLDREVTQCLRKKIRKEARPVSGTCQGGREYYIGVYY